MHAHMFIVLVVGVEGLDILVGSKICLHCIVNITHHKIIFGDSSSSSSHADVFETLAACSLIRPSLVSCIDKFSLSVIINIKLQTGSAIHLLYVILSSAMNAEMCISGILL